MYSTCCPVSWQSPKSQPRAAQRYFISVSTKLWLQIPPDNRARLAVTSGPWVQTVSDCWTLWFPLCVSFCCNAQRSAGIYSDASQERTVDARFSQTPNHRRWYARSRTPLHLIPGLYQTFSNGVSETLQNQQVRTCKAQQQQQGAELETLGRICPDLGS